MPYDEISTVADLCVTRAKRFVWDYQTGAKICCGSIVLLLYVLPYEWLVLVAWFFSGVISSIGFGCGVSTGLLYLIPYYIQYTVEHARLDAWTTWVHVLPACVSHAVGSSVGELPCYILANRLVQRMEPGTVLMRTHEWTVHYVQKWGTVVVFLFALWPNAVFDMAGMAAGICDIHFAAFFAATVLGKAVVKSPAIAFLIVATTKGEILPDYIQYYLDGLLLQKESTVLGNTWFLGVIMVTLFMLYQMMKEFAEDERREQETAVAVRPILN